MNEKTSLDHSKDVLSLFSPANGIIPYLTERKQGAIITAKKV
jgi:hypothetical protein